MKKIFFYAIVILFASCKNSETKDNNNSETKDSVVNQTANQKPEEEKCKAIYPAQSLSIDDINSFFEKGKQFTLQWLCEHSFEKDSNFLNPDGGLGGGEQFAFHNDKRIVNVGLNDSDEVRYIQYISSVTEAQQLNNLPKDLKKAGFKFIIEFDAPSNHTKAFKKKDRYFEVIKYTTNNGYSYGTYYKADHDLEQWMKENLYRGD